MLLLRKILFYFFVVVYLVFCPVVILYSLGYVLNPGTGEGLVKTGLIYLSTAPPGASIYIGDRRFAHKTPTILRDLLPGNYPLKVFLKNYKPWIQTVPVEQEKATVLERILLLRQDLMREKLLADGHEDLIPMPGNHFFLLTRGPRVQDYFVYDWKDNSVRRLLAEDSPYNAFRVESYSTVRDSPHLYLQLRSEEGETFLWLEIREKETKVEDLTPLLPEKPAGKVSWDPRDKNSLFWFRDGILHRLDLTGKTVHGAFLQGIRGYGLFNRQIYFLREDFLFGRLNHDGKDEEGLLDDAELGQSLFGEKGYFKVDILSKDTVLFVGENGELLSNRLPYRFVKSGVKGYEYLPDKERALLWKENSLGVLDFSAEEKGRELFEKGPQLLWIFNEGRQIEQAFWVFEGSHILFRDGDKVYLLEFENYGKPKLTPLADAKKGSGIFYSEDSGRMYYLEPAGGSLCSIEVLPRRDILMIPFPNRKEEKKKSEIQTL